MEHIFVKRIFEMDSKSTTAVILGWIIGVAKFAVTNEALSAVVLAFITGAAAWLGQTLIKEGWNLCKKYWLKNK